MKKVIAIFIILAVSGCKSVIENKVNAEANINTTIDAWHKAAATANYNDYFSLMTDDAIFIGTDATENWNKKAFQIYAKPHFDKGKAWNFTALERHVFIDKSGKTAWFDELLNTQMKVCRGSGVLVKINNQWKIAHYVLSMTIPNGNSSEAIKIKASEDLLIKKLQTKQ